MDLNDEQMNVVRPSTFIYSRGLSKVRRARRALDRTCIVLAVSSITETSSQFYLCHLNNSFRLLLDDYGRLSWKLGKSLEIFLTGKHPKVDQNYVSLLNELISLMCHEMQRNNNKSGMQMEVHSFGNGSLMLWLWWLLSLRVWPWIFHGFPCVDVLYMCMTVEFSTHCIWKNYHGGTVYMCTTVSFSTNSTSIIFRLSTITFYYTSRKRLTLQYSEKMGV